MNDKRPDLEDLAAFADGRISEEARDAVLARLAEDEGYYELLTDLLRFQQQESAITGDAEPRQAPVAEVVLHPSWIRRRAVPWLAAAAALVVAAIGLVPFLRGSATLSVDSVTAGLGSEELKALGEEPWDQRLWSTVRSPQIPYVERRDSFRLGARAVDLRLALKAGDRTRATLCAMEIYNTLASAGVPPPVLEEHRELIDALRQGPMKGLLNRSSQATADLATLADGFYFDYGLWARSGWWAAKAGSQEHFRVRPVVGFAARKDVPEKEKARLQELSAAIEREDLRALEDGLLETLRSVGGL